MSSHALDSPRSFLDTLETRHLASHQLFVFVSVQAFVLWSTESPVLFAWPLCGATPQPSIVPADNQIIILRMEL
jgi:hypothetical protein